MRPLKLKVSTRTGIVFIGALESPSPQVFRRQGQYQQSERVAEEVKGIKLGSDVTPKSSARAKQENKTPAANRTDLIRTLVIRTSRQSRH